MHAVWSSYFFIQLLGLITNVWCLYLYLHPQQRCLIRPFKVSDLLNCVCSYSHCWFYIIKELACINFIANVKATLLTTSNVEYQSCQVGLACLGVAFFTFLLTAIISIPLTFLITCFTMKRKKPDVCPSEQMVSLRTDDVSPADGSKMSMNSVTSEDVEPNS